MPWPEDLVTVAEDAGVGTLNEDLFVSTGGYPPILPSGSCVITETAGTSPDNTQNSVLVPAYINVAAQFMIRASTKARAKELALAYWLAVYPVRNQFINSGWYVWLKAVQPPYDLGKDDRSQFRYVFNVTARKRPEVIV